MSGSGGEYRKGASPLLDLGGHAARLALPPIPLSHTHTTTTTTTTLLPSVTQTHKQKLLRLELLHKPSLLKVIPWNSIAKRFPVTETTHQRAFALQFERIWSTRELNYWSTKHDRRLMSVIQAWESDAMMLHNNSGRSERHTWWQCVMLLLEAPAVTKFQSAD